MPEESKSEGNLPLLYEACVGYMVADRSESNAWKQVAEFVTKERAAGKTLLQIKDVFQAVEQQAAKDFGVKGMPNSWRSAKSTALGAVVKGLALMHEGQPLPKTVIATNLTTRASTPTSTATPTTAHLKVSVALGVIKAHVTKLDETGLESLLSQLTKLHADVTSHRLKVSAHA
jgi:hypothetical protein